MNLVTDQRTETTIHELVPGERPLAFEFGSDDQRLEVMVVIARDPDHRILESGADEFLDLGGVHGGRTASCFPGRAV